MSSSKGSSSWNPSAVCGSANPNETFLSPAEYTSYGGHLEERMVFDIGVYRGGLAGDFHDCIVVSNAKHGSVTLELCLDETRSRIIPMCQQFQGTVTDVRWKKKVECLFKDLTEEAMNIWYEMGSYNLIGRNCQDFCNKFLKCMDAPQYRTTVENAAIGSAGVIGTGLVALLAMFLGRR